MNILWFLVISAYIFVNGIEGGIEGGQCPSYSVQKNFDVTQYLGKWYQYASINTNYFQGKGKCVFAQYTGTDTYNVINVHNEQLKIQSNKRDFIDGTASLVNPSSGEGKLTVTFPIWWFKVTGPYWVLSTDYSNYSIVYGCKSWLWFFHSSSYWILTRQQVLNDTITLDKIKEALESYNLRYFDFEITNQADCN